MPSRQGRSTLGAGLLLYRGGELAQVCAERVKKAQNRVPPDPAPSAPSTWGDVGGMNAEATGQFVLSQVGSLSQRL